MTFLGKPKFRVVSGISAIPNPFYPTCRTFYFRSFSELLGEAPPSYDDLYYGEANPSSYEDEEEAEEEDPSADALFYRQARASTADDHFLRVSKKGLCLKCNVFNAMSMTQFARDPSEEDAQQQRWARYARAAEHLLRFNRDSGGGSEGHLLRFNKRGSGSSRSARSGADHLLRFNKKSADDHMLRFSRSNQDHLLRFNKKSGDDHLLRFNKRGGDDHLLRFNRAAAAAAADHLLRYNKKDGDEHLLRFNRASDDHLLRFNKRSGSDDHMLRFSRAKEEIDEDEVPVLGGSEEEDEEEDSRMLKRSFKRALQRFTKGTNRKRPSHLLRFNKKGGAGSGSDHLLRFNRANDDHLLRFNKRSNSGDYHLLRYARARQRQQRSPQQQQPRMVRQDAHLLRYA